MPSKKFVDSGDPDIDLETTSVRDSTGRRITTEYVERAVEDARKRAPGAGRPSLTGKAAASPRVSFRVTDDTQAKAEQRAKREGRSVSAMAREALERYLAS